MVLEMGPVILGAMEMIVFIQQKSTFIVCSPELGKLSAILPNLGSGNWQSPE